MRRSVWRRFLRLLRLMLTVGGMALPPSRV